MKAVILGGTQGMGREVARQLAARGAEIFLLGLDEEDLKRSATDLEQRAGGNITVGTIWNTCNACISKLIGSFS